MQPPAPPDQASATLQPKKSSSPLSKIKFHSISKKKFASNSKKLLNMNEKFHLINKRNTHTSSSSSFINDEDDGFYYNSIMDGGDGHNRSASSSLKNFFRFGDRNSNADSLEAKNLFRLKHHHAAQASHGTRRRVSDEGDFDVLDF